MTKGRRRGILLFAVGMMILLSVCFGRRTAIVSNAGPLEDSGDYLAFIVDISSPQDYVAIGLNRNGSPEDLHWQYSFDPEREIWRDLSVSAYDMYIPIATIGGEHPFMVSLRTTEKRTGLSSSDEDYWSFEFYTTCGSPVEVVGNVMSLVDPDCQSKEVGAYAFYRLFYEADKIVSAPKLPATTLADHCYAEMFAGCARLTEAPELPATVLADNCYEGMFAASGDYSFSKQSGMTKAPVLPAKQLAKECYKKMFYRCEKLQTAPSLPAVEMKEGCYEEMFARCENLQKAPVLPATKLAAGCFKRMFYLCTSITDAPALPVTKLENSCYDGMFCSCEKLSKAPKLPATVLAERCYANMFQNCESLTETPVLPATKLAASCYLQMFDGTAISKAPQLPVTELADSCYLAMFEGCTNLTEAPALPATTLEGSCYREMFAGCSKLTKAPKLPATTMTYGCYYGMFNGCTSLQEAPVLPATTLAYACYREMFNGCFKLTKAPLLPVTTLEPECYYRMFRYCTSLTEAPELPAEVLKYRCYYEMFEACSSLKSVTAAFIGQDSAWYSWEDYLEYWLPENELNGVFYSSPQLPADAEVFLPTTWRRETLVKAETITYVLNGGSNNAQNPKEYTGMDVVLSDPARKGYNFKGWYLDAAFKTPVSVLKKGNISVYAKWQAKTYNVAFDGNGAASGSLAPLEKCVYDTAYTLPANTFKRSGYKMTGWNTKADGTGTGYANKASVKNLTATSGKTVILYAQWVPTIYTITYELNGGKNAAGNPAEYTILSDTITLASPSRTGYTFKGWYKEDTFVNKATKINAGTTGHKTFYAKWAANQYTIAFNGNGADSGEMADLPKREYDKTYTLRTNAYKKTGFRFVGWNTKADGSGKAYEKNASVKNLTSKNGAVVTLYAQWESLGYKITYVLNGGTNNSANPAEYLKTSETITLKNPKRTGYTFKGWYTEDTFVTKLTQIATGSTGDKTLYAKWAVNTYTVSFDGNGATSGEMNPLAKRAYDEVYLLRTNAFKKTGYTFAGWNTKADGSGTSFQNKQEFSKLSATNGATVVLYAQWIKK